MREGHWSDPAVHCGLFAGPARSSFAAADRIDSSQGELSWLAVGLLRSWGCLRLGMPRKRRAIFSIARDGFVTHATFTTEVGVSFDYHMDDDTLEVDSFSRECYQALFSPRFWGESLGPRLAQQQDTNYICIYIELASFPGLPHLQFLIACSMQKWRGKAWGIFSRDTRHDRYMSSRLRSIVRVMYETDLAFCTTYEDGTSANCELHRLYEAYPGYKP